MDGKTYKVRRGKKDTCPLTCHSCVKLTGVCRYGGIKGDPLPGVCEEVSHEWITREDSHPEGLTPRVFSAFGWVLAFFLGDTHGQRGVKAA